MRLDKLKTTIPDYDRPKKYVDLRQYYLDDMSKYTNTAVDAHERTKKSESRIRFYKDTFNM